MKKILTCGAVLLALSTGAAQAQGAAPKMDADAVTAATNSSHSVLVPIMLLLVIAAVLSGGGSQRLTK